MCTTGIKGGTAQFLWQLVWLLGLKDYMVCKADQWGNFTLQFSSRLYLLKYKLNTTKERNYLHSGSQLTLLCQHIFSDQRVRTPRVSIQKKHIKGDTESTDSSTGQLLPTRATSEFSVLSDFWEFSGTGCAMFLTQKHSEPVRLMPACSPTYARSRHACLFPQRKIKKKQYNNNVPLGSNFTDNSTLLGNLTELNMSSFIY